MSGKKRLMDTHSPKMVCASLTTFPQRYRSLIAPFEMYRERVGGPSESEIEKKKEEANKDRTFSNPDRSGGTQVIGFFTL